MSEKISNQEAISKNQKIVEGKNKRRASVKRW